MGEIGYLSLGELLLVWRMIADGASNQTIARVIGDGVANADRKRTALYQRIGARGVADATRLAIKHGVLQL